MIEASFPILITTSPSHSEAIAIGHCHHSQPPHSSLSYHQCSSDSSLPRLTTSLPSHSKAIAIGHAEALEVEVVQLGGADLVVIF